MLQRNRIDKRNGKINFILIILNVFVFKKYINKILIISLIIISLYNIFSILIISYSPKIDGNFSKIISYLPYKHSIFFNKPLKIEREFLKTNSPYSKKLYNLIIKSEKKSALDYKYWEIKVLHQINNNSNRVEFERNFLNLFILTKNNKKKNQSLKLYYLRNIPRFSEEVGSVIVSK